MCGRYTLSSPIEVVADLFSVDPGNAPQSLEPRFNVAPTQSVPVVRVSRPGAPRTLEMLRWGLIPSWAKEAEIGNRMINARCETAADKPAYKSSFRKNRCLVAADGFYEWKPEGKVKQPFLIHQENGKPFGIAGLWSSWRNPEGIALETFTILTTSPNSLLSPIHDRMPVILDPADYDLWLDPKVQDVERLQALMAPAPVEGWEAVPVSRAVNNPANDSPACLAPVT